MFDKSKSSSNEPLITVLLIDDQVIIGEAIRRMLANESDIIFHFCSDPSLAIQTAIEVAPTVILQDLVMPEIDGLMLLKFFRANPVTRDIPMIVLSSKEEVELKAEAFAIGANDYLVKLPDKIELVARIRYHSRAYTNLMQRDEAYQSIQDYVKKLEVERRKVVERTNDLERANAEILILNQKLAAENIRMGAELSVAQKMQMMILPKIAELQLVPQLDIAAFIQPVAEVGGDYYDVLYHEGKLKIAIGDVTGHGLSSGLIMVMAQTAVRALMAAGETDPVQFLRALNQTLYSNAHRMDSDKNMTLAILDYEFNTLHISGQHEEVIIIRSNGTVERLDTIDLGFPLALEADIFSFINQKVIHLQTGDLVLLYTDGITEATNSENQFYGLDRLCAIAQKYHDHSSTEVCRALTMDLMQFIGKQKIYDDITLVVMKQL